MLKRLVVLTAAALLVFAGACGDDDDDDDGATATTAAPTATTATGGAVELTATLTGSAEVPGPGDADGSGTASVELKPAENQVCYELEVENIATAAAAHIHEGATTVAGPIVVTLEAPADGSSSGCTAADAALIQRISDNPAGFYVNVHNAEHMAGAVRGQLERES